MVKTRVSDFTIGQYIWVCREGAGDFSVHRFAGLSTSSKIVHVKESSLWMRPNAKGV